MPTKKRQRHKALPPFGHRVRLYTLSYCVLTKPRLCMSANCDLLRVRFFHMSRRWSCALYLSIIPAAAFIYYVLPNGAPLSHQLFVLLLLFPPLSLRLPLLLLLNVLRTSLHVLFVPLRAPPLSVP